MIHEAFRMALRWAVTGDGKRGMQRHLSGLMGISSSQISDCLSGRRGFPEEKRRLVAKLLGYAYEDFLALGRAIMRGEDPVGQEGLHQALTERLSIKVLLPGEWKDRPDIPLGDYYAAPLIDGQIAAGPGREIGEGDYRSFVWIYSPALADRSKHDLVAVEVDPVNGDSMAPTIQPGDIVLIDRSDPSGDPGAFASGKIYAVRTGRHEGCAVKRVYAGKKGFVIASENQMKYPPEISWTDDLQELVIGRVVWGWRNLISA